MSYKYHCPECGSAAKIRSYSKIDDYVNCRCLACNHRFAAGVNSPESTRQLIPKRTIPSCQCPSCDGDTRTYCRKQLFVYKKCVECDLKFRMDFEGKLLSGRVHKKAPKDPSKKKTDRGDSQSIMVVKKVGGGKPKLANYTHTPVNKQSWFSGIIDSGEDRAE